jgi:hypothetical protein
MNFTRDDMLGFLRSGKCEVIFTKTDGTTRIMNSTLLEDLIPTDQRPVQVAEGTTVRKESLDTIRVFDTDLQAWRSFRVDSVKAFTTPRG